MKVDSTEIDIFQVSLRCEAAREIGCGLLAKPVLRDLEGLPGICEAWLSRDGNLIAIVKRASGKGAEAAGSALSVFRNHRIAAEALRRERFAHALGEFASRSGWHRGEDVDRLSNEEARIIAARFMARLRTRSDLPGLRANALESAVAVACAYELIQKPEQTPAARKRRLASAALDAARPLLEAPEYAAFTEVVLLGHRPLADER